MEVLLPADTTYIAAFLSLRCNYSCSYCINRHGKFRLRKEMSAEQWINGLNRLSIDRKQMVPITIQGGEPSVHKNWLDILAGIEDYFYVDILTNLTFDVHKFIEAVPPSKFERDVPYAPIRVSYHPEQADFNDLLNKAKYLDMHGYDVGVFAVAHPDININRVNKEAKKRGIDFRPKEFLGWHKGKLYGTYRYPDAMSGVNGKKVMCKTTELLIAPDGNIHRCHRDLYAGENSVGHILDKNLKIEFKPRPCSQFGSCSECDVKIKNSRFQVMGSCSVEITDA